MIYFRFFKYKVTLNHIKNVFPSEGRRVPMRDFESPSSFWGFLRRAVGGKKNEEEEVEKESTIFYLEQFAHLY